MSVTKKPEFEHVDYMDATSYSFDSPIAMSRMARKQHAIKLLEEPDVIPMHIEVANDPSAQFYNFSDEVLVKIFANLWPKELMHIRLVCRRFLELSSDDYLWYNMVKRHVRMTEQERLRGRMKQEEQEKKQEDRPARNQDEKADPSEDSKKPPAKKEKKVRRRTRLDNLKPKDRDWKWVYLSKHTKFSQPCEDKVTGLGQYTWGGGSYYEGEWHEGKPHGKGIKFWEDNEYYLGDWKEGKMDGYGEYHWPDGAVYIGQWKDGYHDGEGLYIWEDGNQYSGSWKLGERDGYGVRTWVDGDVFKGDWVKGKRTGYGTYYWPNGSQFEGQWKNGCHHGVGTYTWLDGRKYTGEWEESKKHGKGVYDFGDGCVFEGEWRTGHRHGAGVMVWSDGTKFMGRYEKDKRNTLHGVCFDQDGNPQPGDWLGTRPYDHYFVEDEEVWEIKYRSNISRRRMQALVALKEKNKGKLPEPIREDKVLDPES